MIAHPEPISTVEDAASLAAFVALLRRMQDDDLPTDSPPPLDGLKGYTLSAIDCFETYQAKGWPAVWHMTAAMAIANPALRRALLPAAPAVAVAPVRQMRTYSADELMALPPVAFLDAERTVQVKGKTMVAGQPGTGKSLWLMHQMLHISVQQPVLMIAEAQGGLGDRARSLQIATGIRMTPLFQFYTEPFNLRDPADVAMLIDRALAMGARVIAFDTWAACTAGADENSVHDVGPIFRTLNEIIELVGCAIVIIHHTRKDGITYRGSSSMLGSVDNMYMLVNEDGVLVLKPEKTRELSRPEPRQYRLTDIEVRCENDGTPVHAPALLPLSEADAIDPQPAKVDSRVRPVLEVLGAFNEGLSLNEVMEATGLTKGSAHRALKKLMGEKLAAQAQHGQPYCITQQGVDALRGM